MEPLYRFWLKGPSTGNTWKMVQDSSCQESVDLGQPPVRVRGLFVYVYVRDGWHNPATGYDSAMGAPFILAPNQPPVLTALKADRPAHRGRELPVNGRPLLLDAGRRSDILPLLA